MFSVFAQSIGEDTAGRTSADHHKVELVGGCSHGKLALGQILSATPRAATRTIGYDRRHRRDERTDHFDNLPGVWPSLSRLVTVQRLSHRGKMDVGCTT